MQNRVKQNAPKRALQLRKTLERLGAAQIKIGQAVSTRVDLLEPEYLQEIERLQDNVPPFPTVQVQFFKPRDAQENGPKHFLRKLT